MKKSKLPKLFIYWGIILFIFIIFREVFLNNIISDYYVKLSMIDYNDAVKFDNNIKIIQKAILLFFNISYYLLFIYLIIYLRKNAIKFSNASGFMLILLGFVLLIVGIPNILTNIFSIIGGLKLNKYLSQIEKK